MATSQSQRRFPTAATLLTCLFLPSVCSLSYGFRPVLDSRYDSTLRIPASSSLHPAVRSHSQQRWSLASSFFGKFDSNEDEEEEEDDDDDDDYEDLDDLDVANFRSKMDNLFGGDGDSGSATSSKESAGVSSSIDELINYARRQSPTAEEKPADWAKESDGLQPGVVLLANPAQFCTDFGGRSHTPSPTLLSKFGLTLPPPADLGPDRRADLLPVLILVDCDPKGRGYRAVLLNRRTGYLLGDLEQPGAPSGGGDTLAPILEKFCIQPLWFGGVDNVSSGLDMLHQCPAVLGATELTEDGLFWGGDPSQAQEAMSDPSLDRVMTGFDFKFFVQSTIWSTKDMEREMKAGTWFTANVSKELLFKSRDRMGTRRAKPLWTEVMELMGGEYKDIRDQLYEG